MKRGMMKGFAIIAAVLMVVSLLPMTALANNGNGFENAPGQMKKTGEMVGIQDQHRKNIQDAKNDYNNMTSEFQMIKRQQARGNLTTEEMINASKDYLNGTIDYMVLRLENIRDEGDYSEDVNDTIDAYIDNFTAIKEDVEAAETRKDLLDALQDIRKLWKDAIKDIRKITTEKVSEGVENHIAKSNSISNRLQTEISQLEDEEEKAELEELLEEYNAKIALAESLLESGDIRGAIDATQDANDILREILDEMKESRDGYVSMTGEGALNAEGNGTIVLSGQFNVTISATDAMLVIKDLAGDADINVDGASYDIVNEEIDGCCAYIYDNFTGEALINGTRLTVMVSGEDLTVFAEGTGSASLSGEGTYQVGEGDEMEFAAVEDDEEVTATNTSADAGTENVDGEGETEEIIEIEVEIENDLAKVIVTINGTIEYEFTFNITDEEEIKNEIENQTSLTYEQINDSIKFEIEEVQ